LQLFSIYHLLKKLGVTEGIFRSPPFAPKTTRNKRIEIGAHGPVKLRSRRLQPVHKLPADREVARTGR